MTTSPAKSPGCWSSCQNKNTSVTCSGVVFHSQVLHFVFRTNSKKKKNNNKYSKYCREGYKAWNDKNVKENLGVHITDLESISSLRPAPMVRSKFLLSLHFYRPSAPISILLMRYVGMLGGPRMRTQGPAQRQYG